MSEAETASTTRGKRSSIRNNSIPSIGGYKQPSQRSVQFRYPVAQFHNLFDEDPGIMSEADTSSTSSRKRRQQLKMAAASAADVGVGGQNVGPASRIKGQTIPPPHHQHAPKDNLPIVRTPSKTLERPLGLVFLVYRGKWNFCSPNKGKVRPRQLDKGPVAV